MTKNKNVPVPMPDEMIAALDQIAEKNEQSRAAVVRLAVKEYILECTHIEGIKQRVVAPKIKQAAKS